MILQHREEGLRAYTQHEHAWLSGELAHAWCGFSGDERLPLATVMAVALHDEAWREEDDWDTRDAPFDLETGRPHDFISMPREERIRIYGEGLDAIESIHPVVAYLVSRHYASFLPERVAPAFSAAEELRQTRLLPALEPDAEALEAHFRLLQLLDLLSLYACMAQPGALEASFPPWLSPEMRLGDRQLKVSWRDASTLQITPFPLREELELGLRFRAVAGRHFDSADAFQRAWSSGSRVTQTLRFIA